MTKAAASPPGSQENRASLAATQAPRAKTGASIDEWPASKSQESVTARVDRGTCPTAACATVGMPITSLSRRNGEPWRNPAKCSSATSAATKACNGRACARRAAPPTRCGAWPWPRQAGAARAGRDQRRAAAVVEVVERDEPRVPTGIDELDRVLGGGLVAGSVVLIGGDPGIGKSTLLLQAGAMRQPRDAALYVTGEESLRRSPARAQRLGAAARQAARARRNVVEHDPRARARRPAASAASSTRSRRSGPKLDRRAGFGQPGARIARRGWCASPRKTGTSVFLVGHVTKEGGIAGPRVLEHMVDAVLYFEGEAGSRFRVLRAFKNRFGAVNELGVFAMGDKGLQEVPNPSAIFLSQHAQPQPGSA